MNNDIKVGLVEVHKGLRLFQCLNTDKNFQQSDGFIEGSEIYIENEKASSEYNSVNPMQFAK